MTEPTAFGLCLKEKRKKYKLNQSQVADAIGKTSQYISNIEKGKNNAPPDDFSLEKLIRVLTLNDDEAKEFRAKAAADRNRLPKTQMEYLRKNKSLIELIEYGETHKITNDKWTKVLETIMGERLW